jgi:hypothetical protein
MTYGKSCLSSGFILSGRYILLNYQDAMAICCCYGAPDLFVTFTCNPKWGEVADVLRFDPVHSEFKENSIIFVDQHCNCV